MELIGAIKSRHSVRKYTDQPVEVTKLATLRLAVEEANAKSGLNTCWAGLTYKKVSGAFSLRDLGIVKYHFEVGAGKENFQWL